MFRENSIKTCILSRVKQITSPGWMHETRAQAWCTGKTQRDRVEREVGAGIGMGNTCNSMADSCQNPLQYCKVISLQLIKINGKKRKFLHYGTTKRKLKGIKDMGKIQRTKRRKQRCQCYIGKDALTASNRKCNFLIFHTLY